eukprot:2887009-Amphidinium_carterae.1
MEGQGGESVGGEVVEDPSVRPMTAPHAPTELEVEQHLASGHVPYRTWCRSCVAGKGRSQTHFHHDEAEDDRARPVIALDYCYLSGVESGEDGSSPVL